MGLILKLAVARMERIEGNEGGRSDIFDRWHVGNIFAKRLAKMLQQMLIIQHSLQR